MIKVRIIIVAKISPLNYSFPKIRRLLAPKAHFLRQTAQRDGMQIVHNASKRYKLQKNQKNFQKSVDKRGRKWYNIQAVAESTTQSGELRRAARSLKIEQQTKKYKLDSDENRSC